MTAPCFCSLLIAFTNPPINIFHLYQECFERAALPATTQEERKRLLSFVIVGGGPTGARMFIGLCYDCFAVVEEPVAVVLAAHALWLGTLDLVPPFPLHCRH